MAIGIDEMTLVSIFVECVLYGFFTFLFSLSFYVLLLKKRDKSERVKKPMLIVSIVMFVLATVHVATDFKRLLTAYIHKVNPVEYLALVNTPSYLLKSTVYTLQTLVGDGFMLYRLYLIWSGDRRICGLVIVCFIASIGVGVGALQAFARISSTAPIFIGELHAWIVSFFTLTLFTNLYCTSLIAARIFWIHRKVQDAVNGQSVLSAAMIIIESGATYTAFLVIWISLYLGGSYAHYIILDGVTQFIGVVFSLIIVRVGLGLSMDTVFHDSDAVISSFAVGNQDSCHSPEPSSPEKINGDKIFRNYPRPPRPVAMMISQMKRASSLDQKDTTLISESATMKYDGPKSEDCGWKHHPFGRKIAWDVEDGEHHEISDVVSESQTRGGFFFSVYQL
ncbi:hypothetical protein DFH11DRAFT_1505454 [Phellopilus nigrolimitatus]|nr:hypothetical protein DFH11DRAFT_1505454 [Phellopilus nigrolimitatus]